MEFDNPFEYKKPEWLVLEEREKRREASKGAGKKRERPYDAKVYINHTRMQYLLLMDLGEGDLSAGVQKLIDDKLES